MAKQREYKSDVFSMLMDFLKTRHMEVMKVLALDYTFERQLELERNDVREQCLAEGLAEGRAEGRAELASAIRMLKEGKSELDLKELGIEDSTIQLAISCLE